LYLNLIAVASEVAKSIADAAIIGLIATAKFMASHSHFS
jgi:hypothetical protein